MKYFIPHPRWDSDSEIETDGTHALSVELRFGGVSDVGDPRCHNDFKAQIGTIHGAWVYVAMSAAREDNEEGHWIVTAKGLPGLRDERFVYLQDAVNRWNMLTNKAPVSFYEEELTAHITWATERLERERKRA